MRNCVAPDGPSRTNDATPGTQPAVLASPPAVGWEEVKMTVDGPPWSVRISLANLDAPAYEAIGHDLKVMTERAIDEWHTSRK